MSLKLLILSNLNISNALMKKQRKKKAIKRSQWFTIAGGLILFLSWVIEKNIQADMAQEKEQLKRSQLVIDITEVQRSTWEVAYAKEINQKPIDTPVLAFIETNLTEVYMNLTNWSEARVKKSSDSLINGQIELKRAVSEQDRIALSRKDYLLIDHDFRIAAEVFGNKFRSLDNDFIDVYVDLDKRERQWSFIFNIFYVVGSLFLGLSYWSSVKEATAD